MSAPLSFALNLTGNFAAQLAPVNAGLSATEKGTHKAAEGVRLFEAELGKGVASMGGFSLSLAGLSGKGSLFTFDLAEGIRGGIELVSSLIGKFIDLGRQILNVAGAAQDLNLAVKLNLGERGAKGLDSLINRQFGDSRHDDDEIKRALLPVARAGLKDEAWLGKIASGAADIEAMSGGEIKLTDAVARLGKVAIHREFNAKLLTDFGINVNDAYKNLADLLHTTPEAAKKAASAGKIQGLTLVSVILDELQKAQGGSIGGAGIAADQTLGATLQRLRDLPENMFRSVADSASIRSLKNELDGFIELMKGEEGTRAISAFTDLLSGIVEIMGGAVKLYGSLVDSLSGEAAARAQKQRNELTIGGRTAHLENSDLDQLFDRWAANKGIGSIKKFFIPSDVRRQAALAQLARDNGLEVSGNFGDGFEQGIRDQLARAGAGGAAVGAALAAGTAKQLEAHSPSQVAMRLGAGWGDGLALGIEGSHDRVGRARSSLLDGLTAIPGGAPAGGTGGGSVFAPHIEINITAPSGDPQALGEMVGQIVRRELRLHYDEMLMRQGGRP